MNEAIDTDESALEQLNPRMKKILNEHAKQGSLNPDYRDDVARGIVDGRDTMRYIGDCDVVEERTDEVVVCGPGIYDAMISMTDTLGNIEHVDRQAKSVITRYAELYFDDKDEYRSLTGSTDVVVLKRPE
jgi:hypothetical protein